MVFICQVNLSWERVLNPTCDVIHSILFSKDDFLSNCWAKCFVFSPPETLTMLKHLSEI